MDTIFYTSALIAVASSIIVITQRNVIYCLLFAVLAVFAIAVIFLVLSAPLLAALQVIIYAGAIMILYLFVLLMLNLGRRLEEVQGWLYPATGLAIGVVLVIEASYIMISSFRGKGALTGITGGLGPKEVGNSLFADYSLGIELASFLLLVAYLY